MADDYTEAELIEAYEERAAVREFDGGMPRRLAEQKAYWDWRKQFPHVVVPQKIQDIARMFDDRDNR